MRDYSLAFVDPRSYIGSELALSRLKRRTGEAVTAQFFLGIDGGGTNCRARVRNAEGRLVGEALGGPSNIATDPVEAIANITKVAEAAFAKGGMPLSRLAQCSACFGLAGANMSGAT